MAFVREAFLPVFHRSRSSRCWNSVRWCPPRSDAGRGEYEKVHDGRNNTGRRLSTFPAFGPAGYVGTSVPGLPTNTITALGNFVFPEICIQLEQWLVSRMSCSEEEKWTVDTSIRETSSTEDNLPCNYLWKITFSTWRSVDPLRAKPSAGGNPEPFLIMQWNRWQMTRPSSMSDSPPYRVFH